MNIKDVFIFTFTTQVQREQYIVRAKQGEGEKEKERQEEPLFILSTGRKTGKGDVTGNGRKLAQTFLTLNSEKHSENPQ